MDFQQTKLIACAAVIEEIRSQIPEDLQYEILDFNLHLVPHRLKETLQKAIDAIGQDIDTLILGYGLCSMAVVGVRANHCQIIIPRVDDCIALFLGSQSAYQEQLYGEPGTYFLSRGWIEAGDTLIDDYGRLIQKYGIERADSVMSLMMANYTRLAFIDTGYSHCQPYYDFAQHAADQLGLQYEKIESTDRLLQKMLHGPWDDDFIVIQPGQTITYSSFKG
jgi:hypothetical protein